MTIYFYAVLRVMFYTYENSSVYQDPAIQNLENVIGELPFSVFWPRRLSRPKFTLKSG